MVVHLGKPLLADVLEGSWAGDGEADQEDVGLGIRERAETVVIFLSGGIEESEGVGLIADPGERVLAGISTCIECIRGIEV